MPLLGATGGGSAKGFGALANLGYFIKNSLRFRSSASAYLSRTPASAGDTQKWTWSAWIKLGKLSTFSGLFGALSGTDRMYIGYGSSAKWQIYGTNAGTDFVEAYSTGLYRDPSAWYHLVIAIDTTQATAANRLKMYVNGNQETVSFTTNMTLNANTSINKAIATVVGETSVGNDPFDGYMAEINFIDGQALTPSSFGKTDAVTNQWIPKKFAGTYGTNGYYLKFADTSAATAAAIGKDSSGNGNNWTPNNISVTSGVTYDAMIDSPTLSAAASNYCVLNPLDMGANITISDGNLKFVSSSSAGVGTCRGSMAFPTTGKWYFEVTAGSTANANDVGIANANMDVTTGLGDNANGWGYSNDGFVYNNGTFTNTSATWGNGDIAGIAFDADSGRLWFAKNNTWVLSGNPSANTNPTFSGLTGNTFFPAVSDYGGGSTSNLVANFGQRPFSYTPPTSFKALNAFNLP